MPRMGGCPVCEGRPEVGILCSRCASGLPPCEGLLPEHVSSSVDRAAAGGWLIDGFGAAHAVRDSATVIGRNADAGVVILNGSVSREHAELQRQSGGWIVRDLGSRNGTHVGGVRIHGRAALADGSQVRFGDVAFLFLGHHAALPAAPPRPVETHRAPILGSFRVTLRGPTIDICLVSLRDDAVNENAGGALLYRPRDAATWSEKSLPPLEFQLLRTLCLRALEESGSPSVSKGCVPTRELAKLLPFQSKYANEENVRQVVRRIRTTLEEVGADGLVEALRGRGYYLTWPVATA